MKAVSPKGRDSRIKEIFLRAVDLPQGVDHDAFLEDACRGDETLRHDVESLLASRGATTPTLERDFLAEAFEPADSLVGRYP